MVLKGISAIWQKKPSISVTRIVVSTFGAIVGVAGIEHGIGEILQGNTPPSGIIIESWPDSELYDILAGEPAMTLIPNLLIAGILSIIVSIVLVIWAIRFIHKKHGGLVLILLSIILLLVGGGFGPPIIGIILGLAGKKINSQFKWLKKHLSVSALTLFSKLWWYSYIACIIGWLSLWPGSIILVYFFGIKDPFIITFLSLFSFGTLFSTIFSGFAYDSINNTRAPIF